MAVENLAAQRQTAKTTVTAVYLRTAVCQYSMAEEHPVVQSQTAVTAYLKSKQLLLCVLAIDSPLIATC